MKPFILNPVGGKSIEIQTRLLEQSDLVAFLSLQKEAVTALSDRSLCDEASVKDFTLSCSHKRSVGIFCENGLIAAILCTAPLPYSDAPARITQLVVHPNHQGEGLGKELIWRAAKLTQSGPERGRISATVSPKNIPAVIAMLAADNFRITALRLENGHHLRYTLVRDPAYFPARTTFRRLSIYDTYSISRALADGFEGITYFRDNSDTYLWFAK